MRVPGRAAQRFRRGRSLVLLAALLLAASASLQAAERQRPSDSSDHGRTAVPRDSGGSSGTYSPPPSQPPSYPSSPPTSTSSDDPPRRAVPRDGGSDSDGPHRQRPHVDRDGRGGGGGGGYYYPGYYYPRYYGSRYYGPFWGWGSFWSWYFYDDWFYYGQDYGWPPYGRGGYYGSRGSMGALDLDVSPGRAEVYIDGRYQGIVDQYDGFPQYLWLPKGTYDVVLFREGYRTIARQISIYPGSVISVDDRLERGESVRPEDLASKTHDRRDERIRSERERREEISRRGNDEDGEEDAGDWRDWRDRGRYRRGEREGSERNEEERRERVRAGGDESGARVRLDIEPSDASVYIDGRFVGTGLDLERGPSLRLDPGEHRIAVVRPGHKAEEKEFTVAAGEELELEIELDSLE